MGGSKGWKWWSVVVTVVVVMVVVSTPAVVKADSQAEERRPAEETRVEMSENMPVEMRRKEMEEVENGNQVEEEEEEDVIKKKEIRNIKKETTWRRQLEAKEMRRKWRLTEEEEDMVEEEIKEEKERITEMEKRKEVDMRVEEVEEEELPVLHLYPTEVSLVSGESCVLKLRLTKDPAECIYINFTVSEPLGTLNPSEVELCAVTTDDAPPTTIFTTTKHGTTTITAIATPEDLVTYPRSGGAFSVVSVMKSKGITTTADVLGWVYTIAWDISFLPQIVHNWRRKSVIGLSFDFLTFNFVGFFSYFLFNMGLYWIPAIQDQYEIRFPQSILHVRLNDVMFPLYALLCVTAQITQCFFYKRGVGQRVSIPCRVMSGLLILVAVIGCILVPVVDGWLWLDVLYLFSYIKLAITCIKYVPQLYVNYSHRSTEGWSIYAVILDFTGGVFSLVQMFLLSANYDDWHSLVTDPAKLGLGLLSIFFNIFFFIQHYILYRHAPLVEKKLKGEEGPIGVLETPPSLSTPPAVTETGLRKGKKGTEEQEEKAGEMDERIEGVDEDKEEGKGEEKEGEEELKEVVMGGERKEGEEERAEDKL